jgi:hypothetical protein
MGKTATVELFQVLTRPFERIANNLGTTGEPEMEPAIDPVVIRKIEPSPGLHP